ncbi:hypothetical protein C1645_819976 [Glomus cerebriforme]|uniref:Uncharacterized protein n=1 Tax=Glomus cerebriforme TaxID=658196 RepID=A0A397T6U0_9GLOM|nr:hypothetical protein C1645_819976 [Glomus cerebriforme]
MNKRIQTISQAGIIKKKIKNLIKAFDTAEKYRGGGKKKSLIREEIYNKFKTKFWLKPGRSSEEIFTVIFDVHNESIRRLGEESSGEGNSDGRSSLLIQEAFTESSTSLIPDTSPKTVKNILIHPQHQHTQYQHPANVINVTINNNYASASDEKES